jgi:hypothetical protein
MDITENRQTEATVNKIVRMGVRGLLGPSALRVLVVLGLSWCIGLPAYGATLYRYINDKGYQEIGYSVPNHLVPNGYDVIDDSGRLVRRVAAQLSEAEYAVKLEQERKLEACQKAMARVHRRYEALTDIDDAERLFEEKLEESLKNAKANLDYSQAKLAEQQELAANMERSGKVIPKHLLDNMNQTEQQIQALTSHMVGQEQGAVAKAEAFDEERRVFQLTDCQSDQLASVQ